MKYLRCEFSVSGAELDDMLLHTAYDLISGITSEAGFETFAEEEGHLAGYVQEEELDREKLDELLSDFPLPGLTITYTLSEAEDKDWNEAWEETGFDPIVIDSRCVIHDTKHPVELANDEIEVLIDAKMAFGSGTHATTQLMVSSLLNASPSGKRVLDCGCGTGILSLVASKAGAESVVAYDIDEWSVDNTRHNAALNQVDNIEVFCGDINVLSHISGEFAIVMANINRNILLADMESMVDVLMPGGSLIISGFYQSDEEILVAKAEQLGLKLQSSSVEDDWASLSFIS